MTAMRLEHTAAGASRRLRKSFQAFRARDLSTCAWGRVICVSMNYERRDGAGITRIAALRLGQSGEDLQQFSHALALLKKSVRCKAGRHLVAEKSAAHGDG